MFSGMKLFSFMGQSSCIQTYLKIKYSSLSNQLTNRQFSLLAKSSQVSNIIIMFSTESLLTSVTCSIT